MLRHFVYLAAPPPKRHTLDGIEYQDVWYGTVPNKQITLIVKRREKMRTPSFYMGGHTSSGGDGATAAKVVVKAWLIDKSLWKPRKMYADSRSFWDHSSVFKRGMQIDWARCCTDRFKKTVLPFKVNEDPVRTERELGRIKTILELHCQLLYQTFSYYSVGTAMYGHTAMWSQAAYSSFYNECQIALSDASGEKNLAGAMSYIDNIFLVATMDVPKSDPVSMGSRLAAQVSAVDLGKGKGALLRYGFVAAIVRLAVAVFKEEAAVSPAWAVERLVAEHLMPSLPPLARCIPDDFRNHKLYASEVEEVYRKHLPSLRAAFKHYSGRDTQGVSQKGEGISLDEFVKLLSEGELLDSGLTWREAGYAFVHSQMFVADEVKRREKLLILTFEGFLEALARLTLFKAMPTASQLAESRVHSPADFFDQLDKDGSLAGWVSRNTPHWKTEEKEGTELHEVLDKLITLLIYRLDLDCD